MTCKRSTAERIYHTSQCKSSKHKQKSCGKQYTKGKVHTHVAVKALATGRVPSLLPMVTTSITRCAHSICGKLVGSCGRWGLYNYTHGYGVYILNTGGWTGCAYTHCVVLEHMLEHDTIHRICIAKYGGDARHNRTDMCTH